MAVTLPRNADVAGSTCSPTCSSSTGQQFQVLAYRRAADQIRSSGSPIAQLALDGRAKDLPGSARRSRARSSRSSTGADRGADKRKAQIPAGVAEFLRLPASAPRPPAGSGRSSGSRRSSCGKRRRRTPPDAAGAGREQRNASSRRSTRSRRRSRRCSPPSRAAVRAVVEVLRDHPASDEVSEAGSVRRRTETVKDLDIIATTASDLAALTDLPTKLTWVAEVEAKGKTEATVVSPRPVALRPARRAARGLRQPPPALHRLEAPQRRAPARTAVRRGLSSLNTASRTSRQARSGPRARGGLCERLGYQWMPPSSAKAVARSASPRNAALPGSWRSRPRGAPPHALDVVERRQEHARGNGVRRQGRGYEYVAITDHAPTTAGRPLRGSGEGDREAAEEAGAVQASPGIEVSIRVDGTWTSRTRTGPNTTGWSRRCTRPSTRADRADPRGDAESARRLRRAPTARKLNKRAASTSTSRRSRRRGSRRGRTSRSTPS